MRATALAESSGYLSTFIVICLLQRSTDISQVGIAIFPSFKHIFYDAPKDIQYLSTHDLQHVTVNSFYQPTDVTYYR